MNDNQNDKLFTLHEASKILGKSPITLRRMIKSGKLSAHLIKGRKHDQYAISQNEISYQLNKNMITFQHKLSIEYLLEQRNKEFQDLYTRQEQLLIRLGQLESQRMMLTERAESLAQKEAEYRAQLELKEKENQQLKILLEEKQKIIEQFTKKKWWQFWKKPAILQTSST